MNVVVMAGQAPEQSFSMALLSQWMSQPYAELSVLLSWLRALQTVHQSNHWQSSADPFYGDHKLYDRIYEGVTADIDRVAEKAVGMGTADLVSPCIVMHQANAILAAYYLSRPGIPQPNDLAVRSLHMERTFIGVITEMAECLATRHLLTKGVDNMLAELADRHEGNVYLLKQRATLGGV